jgi:hypothetical protein
MRFRSIVLMAAIAAASPLAGAAPADGEVFVAGDPLVLRLNKDEFRIVFGVEAKSGLPEGRSGSVRYRVEWKAADGAAHSEVREVSYTLLPQARRTIAVDRQYLDTAEGAHTVDVVRVSIDGISRD